MIAIELVERGNFAGEDVYIRPLVYTASEVLGVRLHNVDCDTLIFVTPFPAYLPEVARCHTSTWRRVDDTGIPPRAKVTGIYANSALAKTEANLNGFDEAIMLDPQGYVAECSGENIFVVRNGKIFTPPTTTILEGITRDALITIARDLGCEVSEQMISRDQLYIADEVFVCGTAAECIALREIDFRVIGSGKMGPVTRQIQQAYQAVIHGKTAKYAGWLELVK